MTKARKPFQTIIEQLEAFYGQPAPPKVTDPLEMILLENAAISRTTSSVKKLLLPCATK